MNYELNEEQRREILFQQFMELFPAEEDIKSSIGGKCPEQRYFLCFGKSTHLLRIVKSDDGFKFDYGFSVVKNRKEFFKCFDNFHMDNTNYTYDGLKELGLKYCYYVVKNDL